MPSNYVPPDGSLDSRLAYVGARPGRDEVYYGRGFVGPSGELLWKLSRFPRSDCYVTNVRKDFSEKNSVPTKDEIREVLPDLRDELSRCRANIFVCIGREAGIALTGRSEIDKWRGSVIESSLLPGRKVLITWHTAAALRTYSLRYIIDLDLRRAAREAAYPDIRRKVRTFHINPPFLELLDLIRALGPVVTVDIETFGQEISVIGLTDSADKAICIATIGGPYTVSELIAILRELDRVLRTRAINGQNIQFDTSRLERLGLRLPRLAHDTMLSHHLLWTELGSGAKRKGKGFSPDEAAGKHKLEFLISCYTDIPFYKDQSNRAWTDPNLTLEERFYQYWEYNCWDVCGEHEVMEKEDAELVKYGQKEYYQEHVVGLIRPVMTMQGRGVNVDLPVLQRMRVRKKLECDYLQGVLNREAGYAINVKSGKDMAYLLTDVCKIPASQLSYTPKHAISTKEEHLRRIAYNSPHAGLIKLVLDVRERRTLISGFLGMEASEDGRYYAAFLLHGTGSGRLSSRAIGKGPQLQNIPKGARGIFVASPGCTLVRGDYPRAEAKHVAYDSGCKYLMELFSDPDRDLYGETAARILRKPLRQVTKGTIEREAFKHLILGSNYGLGPDKLVTTLRLQGHIDIADVDIPGDSRRAKAKYVLSAYFALCPEIPVWQDRIWREGCKSRVLYSDFGRRRMFLGRLTDREEEGEKSTKNIMLSYRAQSTVVGGTNQAIRRLYDKYGEDSPTVLQVHDELVLDVPTVDLAFWINELNEVMSFTVRLPNGLDFSLAPEIEFGPSWSPKDAYSLKDLNKLSWGVAVPEMTGEELERVLP